MVYFKAKCIKLTLDGKSDSLAVKKRRIQLKFNYSGALLRSRQMRARSTLIARSITQLLAACNLVLARRRTKAFRTREESTRSSLPVAVENGDGTLREDPGGDFRVAEQNHRGGGAEIVASRGPRGQSSGRRGVRGAVAP